MRRRALFVVLMAVFALPIAAQVPGGWKVRVDGSPSATAPDAKFMKVDKGVHVTGGPAGIFFDPAHTAMGNYTLKATFTLMKPGDKATPYGLVFGANDVEGGTPSYVYFTIAQDGSFQVRQRTGDKVNEVSRSIHVAIQKPDASGKSMNTLEVQVAPTAITYLVNGTVVDASPILVGPTSKTSGIVGFRIDDALDVQVEGLEVKGA